MAKKNKSKMSVENCCAPAMDRQRERQYQIEDGLRTMQRAAEIVSDKGLMKDIKALAKKTVDGINKVAK